MSTSRRYQDAAASLLLACLSFLLYWWSMPRSITLIDAGLFQMVCDANGLAHPSGFPIATVICHELSLLPLPNVVAGNLISLVFGSASVAILYLVARALHLQRDYAIASAALLAVSADFWSQSIIVEVYTLNSFLFLLLMWLGLLFANQAQQSPIRDRRLLIAIAFVAGAALANHWPLIVISAPTILLLLLHRQPAFVRELRQVKTLFLMAAGLLIGLMPYLLLLTKNDHEMLTHGRIESISEWLYYILRLSYNDTVVAHALRSYDYLWWLPLQSVNSFTLIAWLLIPVGIVSSFKRLGRFQFAAILWLWAASCLLLPLISNYPFNYEMQAIVRTWILLAHISCALWIGFGLQQLGSLFLARRRPQGDAVLIHALIPVPLLLIVIFVAVTNATGNYRANDRFVDYWGRTLLARLAPDAVLLVQGDTQTGVLGFLHYVEGVRPDIEIRNMDNILFSNRLMQPRSDPGIQQEALLDFVRGSTKPVYSIYRLPLPAEDFGLYLRYNTSSSGLQPINIDDVFYNRLLDLYETQPIADPTTRILIDNLTFDYARLVIGQGIQSENPEAGFLRRLSRVSETFPGKVWTLHHLLGGHQQLTDKPMLLGMAEAGELQITDQTNPVVAAEFYKSVAELFVLPPSNQDLAVSYYLKSRHYQGKGVGVDDTCESAVSRLDNPHLKQLGCMKMRASP